MSNLMFKGVVSRMAAVGTVLAVIVAGCGGSSSPTFSAQSGGGGGMQICIGGDAPNTDDPSSSDVSSLASSLSSSGRGYFAAWQTADADPTKWPGAAKVEFLFFSNADAAQKAFDGQIKSDANKGGDLYGSIQGNLVMVMNSEPTTKQSAFISSCLKREGGTTFSVQQLITAQALKRLQAKEAAQAAQPVPASQQIGVEVSNYLTTLEDCSAKDSSVEDIDQANNLAGSDTFGPVDPKEYQRIHASQDSLPTQFQDSDSFEQNQDAAAWDVYLYPSAAIAQARIATVTAEAKQSVAHQPPGGIHGTVQVWQMGNTLIVSAGLNSASQPPSALAKCVQSAQHALSQS